MLTRRVTVTLSAFGTAALLIGCSSARPIPASDETFFEPLKSLPRPTLLRTDSVAQGGEQTNWSARADSLLNTMKEQGRRIGVLTEQLKLLDAARSAASVDSASKAKKQTAQPAVPVASASAPGTMTYDRALRIYEAGRYERAITAFQELLRRGIQKDLEDNCHFWIGVSEFSLRRFDRAAKSFQTVINWKSSNKRADACFMLGQTYEQLGDVRQAKVLFETLITQFPRSELVPTARQKLRALGSTK